MNSSEQESLQRQLKEARANLRLIEERQAEFVLGIDVPLQLIREERRLRGRIAELNQKLAGGASLSAAHPAIDLAAGVVAICNANGDIVGAGFVASPELIVTCAHVVEQAGGEPGGSISVRFHLNKARQTAQILNRYWRNVDAEDLAILRLTKVLPAGVVPLPLGEARGSDKHAFRSLGYPDVGDYEGLVADGMINAVIRKADGREMVQITSSQLARGHSGAPVWDEVQQAVIGVVSEVYEADRANKNRDTAFATPIEAVWQICPELRQK